MKIKEPLAGQSMLLITAALTGHVFNYAFHMISGRMLSGSEYGLMMALFGMVNLLLMPMSALGLALTRTVAVDVKDQQGRGLLNLVRKWSGGMILSAGLLLLAAVLAVGILEDTFNVSRSAPFLLAALIPGFNLLLTLSGSLLQGLQRFKGLALRNGMLFVLRALLVAGCLALGWRAAGWALLAHILGMAGSLAVALWYVWPAVPRENLHPAPATGPILLQSLKAFPVLMGFSILMSADVILARRFFDPEVAGRFAQAATLGRMILWLPLPIAQVMFPKVVREGTASSAQRNTLRKAMAYSLVLVAAAGAAAWLFAPLALRIVYGIGAPSPEQIGWLRGIALAMTPLGPVYLLLQYELARGEILRMLHFCILALLFPLGVIFYRHESPSDIIWLLSIANGLALVSSLPLLRKS